MAEREAWMRRPGRRAALAAALSLSLTASPAMGQTLSPDPVTVSDFDPVTLDGTATSTTATISDFSVADSSGAGWHVTVQGTQFREFDPASANRSLAAQRFPPGR